MTSKASSSSGEQIADLHQSTSQETDNSPLERQDSRVPVDVLDPQGVAELSRNLSRTISRGGKDEDKEAYPTCDPFDKDGKFELEIFLKELFSRAQDRDVEQRSMGVAFQNLRVTGVGSGVALGDTVGSLVTAPFEMLSPSAIRRLFRPPVKTILHSIDGYCRPGEMLLVLGRPGAGCTSLLKALASYRDGFKDVDGTVLYEGFDHKAIDGLLRGEVTYAPEDDIHFPSLSVKQTLDFAAATRTPQASRRITLENDTRKEHINMMRESIATILGLRHTYNTKVGNELIRGVSGGEKKRVSIAEIMTTRALVRLFDNSSRGLDASTALEFVQALRIMTDISKVTTVASIYQAGESLVNLFDRVLVLNEGHEVYCGPVKDAAQYFIDLGFRRIERQTVADFLVACTDEHGRQFREGCERSTPRSPVAMEKAWRESQSGQTMVKEVSAYVEEMKSKQVDQEHISHQKSLARQEKAKTASNSSRYLLSWFQQIRLAFIRRAQISWGDISTQLIVTCAVVFQALIMGSVFLAMPKTTAGFFSRGGVIFFALLYSSFMAMTEIVVNYAQKPIVIRQARFAQLHPAADSLATTILDIPVRAISIGAFDIVLYFMTGLYYSADNFFIFLFMTLLLTYTMVAFFRALSATCRSEANATLLAGLTVIITALYTGYVIPRPSMVIWWKWLSYCNPVSFAFEVLMTSEFRKLIVPCAGLIPAGAALANQVCPVASAQPGVDIINGSEYLAFSYGYYFSNSGRNVGIIFGFWIFFVTWYCIATEYQSDPQAAGAVLVFRRGGAPKAVLDAARADGDLEKQGYDGDPTTMITTKDAEAAVAAQEADQEKAVGQIIKSQDIFSWHNITFDVMIGAEKRRLLNDVSGYVEPGKMTALVGESGAGKTTLLNVLAQRGDVGVVGGTFLVNSEPLPRSFQAGTGYCQQQDVHLPTSTVREALQFSALLRQSAETPREEKLAYVEAVIDMLEMHDWAEALVGEVGAGLNVEQRKRLTIGVELAAKPSLLLFLDEPTSGLDAQAAWSIVRFLRKLADAGQAILCTIHQPSGELFSQFDRLCMLKKGGEVVYFGDIGKNSRTLLEYFEERSGRAADASANPAEYILDVIGAGATAQTDKDWAKLFRESELNSILQADLKRVSSIQREQSPEDIARGNREYAAPLSAQIRELFWRTFTFYWRNPTYVGAKLALNVICGLFIGSSFWNQGQNTSVASLQNKLFGTFMALVISTSLAQQLQPIFLQLRNIYDARERPSKLYSWPVLVASSMVVELPWNVLGGTLFWVSWYWMVGFSGEPARASYSWGVYSFLFEAYFQTFAQAVASVSPNALVASVLFSTFFSFVIVFCGVVQPPPLLPTFWRKWMFDLTPFKYLIEGLLGNTLGGQPVRCTAAELNTVIPPAGQSCADFLTGFSSPLDDPNPVGTGYFLDGANGTCSYCNYRVGDDYLSSVLMKASNKYRNIGILVAYIAFNVALCFVFFWLYSVRAHKKTAEHVKKPMATAPAAGAPAATHPTAINDGGKDAVPEPYTQDQKTLDAEAEAAPPTSSVVDTPATDRTNFVTPPETPAALS